MASSCFLPDHVDRFHVACRPLSSRWSEGFLRSMLLTDWTYARSLLVCQHL